VLHRKHGLRGKVILEIEMLAAVLQARGGFGQLLLIYLIICTIPLVLGVYLLAAPRRGGNFLNDAFASFPHVERGDRLKELFYRALGPGINPCLGVLQSSGLPEHCVTDNTLPAK